MTPDRPVPGRLLSGYEIAGGRADADRLGRQADVMAAATAALLTRVGLRSGWACLDVGCGTGQVTGEMARAAGLAVGVDRDAEALGIAQGAAAAAGLPARFVCADAAALPVRPGTFDLAYARLLLGHVPGPLSVLRQLCAAVRPAGVVAVEDLFTGTLRSAPSTVALDELQDVYAATVRARGGDPTIGPRLPALLSAAGLVAVHEETVTNAMTTVEEKLFLVELLDNMRTAILATGAADASRLDRVRAAVDEAARHPGTTFYQARIHQVWGRRPGPSVRVDESQGRR
jgi:ubiquinone/menaquinone biosynthesis C-methylase UbiE